MPERRLRITELRASSVGVCESCNMQFKSDIPKANMAAWELKILFDRHKCGEGKKPIKRA